MFLKWTDDENYSYADRFHLFQSHVPCDGDDDQHYGDFDNDQHYGYNDQHPHLSS